MGRTGAGGTSDMQDNTHTTGGARELDWDDLRPNGAVRFYEGDDPDRFAAEMKAEFGFDVTEPHEFGDGYRPTDWAGYREFFIPAGLVQRIYGSERWAWELGS
jgi:hypothetical protein